MQEPEDETKNSKPNDVKPAINEEQCDLAARGCAA